MNRVVEVERSPATLSEPPGYPRWIRISFWVCIFIAAAAVLRRLLALAHPSQSGPPQVLALDAVFSSHVALTLALEALVPSSVTEAGDTVQVPAGGAPEQLKATVPVKPLTGATLSV